MSESIDKTIESVYFHWGNGGLSIKVVENTHKWTSSWEDPGEIRMDREIHEHVDITYRMEVGASHHGASMETSFDLGSMEVVGWLHEMTGRLLKRMAGQPNQSRLSAFDYHPAGRVGVRDGEQMGAEGYFRWKDGELVNVDDEHRMTSATSDSSEG